jgi:hypothetical protein
MKDVKGTCPFCGEQFRESPGNEHQFTFSQYQPGIVREMVEMVCVNPDCPTNKPGHAY